MIGEAAEHLVQIGFGIEPVELGGLDERVGRGGARAAGIGSCEQIVLPAENELPDRALSGIVADLQSAVIEIARERGPARAGIADCFGQIAAA